MRNLSRLGLIILLALGAMLASASIAAAGGPTSLLITSPQNQRTSSAYVGDARYQRLAGYVGLNTAAGVNQSTSGESPPAGIDSNFGAETRLTWLIHDMSVWRVDRLYFTGDVVWINTTTMTDWGSDDAGEGVWHRTAEPAKLRAAVAETGVLRKPTSAPPESESPPSDPPAVPDPTPSASEPADAAATATTGGPPAGGLIGLGSGLLGLAAGIGATLLVLRLRTRQQPDRIVLTG